MRDQWFDRPVTVLGARPVCRQAIGRPSRAAWFLVDQWPDGGRTKLKYRKAAKACRDALSGTASAGLARAAFLAAAKEADILITEPTQLPASPNCPPWPKTLSLPN